LIPFEAILVLMEGGDNILEGQIRRRIRKRKVAWAESYRHKHVISALY
jgi:hypothetical protein